MTDAPARILALSHALGARLSARGWMLATAESCTGGGIGYAVTQVPGSSVWYDRGFVTYSNEAKIDLLKVSAALIDEHGAVSEPVAHAMALGALIGSRAQAAVAVTGIAGPGGGSADKPVGTVCVGWALKDDSVPMVVTRRMHFAGDRAAVRTQSIIAALEGLLALLEDLSDRPE
jgi:nicotinamide-nucleotide amidase